MSENGTDTDFSRDKFIFEIMVNRYNELERKTNIIDSKSSNMIAVIGTLLTIQGSIYTFLLSWFINQKQYTLFCILILVLIMITLGYYTYSMKLFIDSYSFKQFKGFPNSNRLIEYIKQGCDEHEILGKSIGSIAKSNQKNHMLNQHKVKKAKEGFEFFKIAGIFSISFVFLFTLGILILN